MSTIAPSENLKMSPDVSSHLTVKLSWSEDHTESATRGHMETSTNQTDQ